MSRYEPWPLVKQGEEWSIPDETLRQVWRYMVAEKKAATTFYDGGVVNEEEFIAFMHSPVNLPVLLVDTTKNLVCMVAWLNGLENRSARCHFCVLGPYKRGMAEAIVNYWSSFKLEGTTEPLFRVIVGLTPETYTAAVKLLRVAGYKIVGTVPFICNLRYEGRFAGAVISYYCPKGG